VECIHLLFDEDESLMVVLLDNLNSDLQWANLVMTSTFFLPVKRGLM